MTDEPLRRHLRGHLGEVPRAEIERTVSRYGATGFMYGWQSDRAVIAFECRGRQVRFILPMPDRNNDEVRLTETGKVRSATAAANAYDQAIRQRWRALALVVKAKLESVESGIVTFEQEFLAHLVLPDGSTVGDTVLPRVAEAYATGQVPELLPPARAAIEAGGSR